MNTTKKITLFFGIMWATSGASKLLMLIAENFTGKAMVTSSFQTFAKFCIIPAYTDIIVTYFIPMAGLFIFLAGFSEFIAGLLIIRSGNLAKLGFAMGIAMNVVYAPLVGIPTVIVNIIFAAIQAWLWKKS